MASEDHRERRADVIRRSHEAGRSATQSADDLFEATHERLTRNAIIGHWHRMGLTGTRTRPAAKQPRPPRPARRVSAIVPTRPAPAAFPVAFKEPVIPVRPTYGREPVVPPEGVTILELRLSSCRWPLWSGREPVNAHSSRYCGEPREHDKTSYCEKHRLMAKGSPWQG